MIQQSHLLTFIGRKQEVFIPLLITASLTPAKIWKQLKYSPTGERLKKMWHISTMNCHSAIKKKETLRFALVWMNLGGDSLINSELSQREKIKSVWRHSYVE